MEITSIKVRRISGAEARNSPFSVAFAQSSFQYILYAEDLLLFISTSRPVLFCFLFLSLSNLNSSHFDPSTMFSCRISQSAFKGSLWLGRVRIWRCHCCGYGYCSGGGSIPGPGTSAWRGQETKKAVLLQLKEVPLNFITYNIYLKSIECILT